MNGAPCGQTELRGALAGDHPTEPDGSPHRRMGMSPTMTEIESVLYLVHFPDRHKAIHHIEIGRVAEVGTEILDGWVVDEIKQTDDTIDEKSGRYEVWVRPRLTQ